MPKVTATETPQAASPAATPQTKRYDEAFKRQAATNATPTSKATGALVAVNRFLFRLTILD
jgi:hypothetical protein